MDKKLKIVVITPMFPIRGQPYRGHPVYQTVCALQSFADVEVICINSRYPSWCLPSRYDYRPIDPTYKPPHVRTHYLAYNAIPGLTRGINGYLCARAAAPLVGQLKPDVILNYWLYPEGYAAVALGRQFGVPTVVGSVGSDLNRIGDPLSRYLTRLTLRRAAITLTKSAHLRQQAIGMGADPARVRTVLNGCDTSIFRVSDRKLARTELEVEQETKRIVYVGRLDLLKGVQELLEAFAVLAMDRPNLRLTYIGDGPAQSSLQEHIARLGLHDRIRLEGPKDTSGVAQWLAASDVFCLPSYAEGCPNAILEALSCGRPVVATNVGGIPEIVNEQCAILVAPKDSVALAAALDSALTSDWDAELIAQQFRRGWDDVAREVYAACSDAVQAGKPQPKGREDATIHEQVTSTSMASR